MIKLIYSNLEPGMPFFSQLWKEWWLKNNSCGSGFWNTVYTSTKGLVPTYTIKRIYD